MKRSKYVCYRDSRRNWRFRLVAKNGENVGPASEAYETVTDVRRAVADHRRAARWARIVIDPK